MVISKARLAGVEQQRDDAEQKLAAKQAQASELAVSVLEAMKFSKDEITVLQKKPSGWIKLIEAIEEFGDDFRDTDIEDFHNVLKQVTDGDAGYRKKMRLALQALVR